MTDVKRLCSDCMCGYASICVAARQLGRQLGRHFVRHLGRHLGRHFGRHFLVRDSPTLYNINEEHTSF